MNEPTESDGFAIAQSNRTEKCTHPACGELAWLSCVHCGVLIMEGKVLDPGGDVREAEIWQEKQKQSQIEKDVEQLKNRMGKLEFLFCSECQACMLNFVLTRSEGRVFLDHHEKTCSQKRG